jgi:hypothetical protein
MRGSGVGVAVFAVAWIAVLLCIAPSLMLWSVNTFFEQADIAYQIPHNVWTYLAVWVLLALFKVEVRVKK